MGAALCLGALIAWTLYADANAHHLKTPKAADNLRPGCQRHYRAETFRRYTKARYRKRSSPLTDGQKTHTRHLARCLANKRKTRRALDRKRAWRARFRARLYHQRHRMCGTTTCNSLLVYWLEFQRSGSSQQASCLKSLAFRESGWDERARNPSSGAYGIPQALPGEKMASHGSDWSWNPVTQIRWMMDYVRGRYGSACGALAHSNSAGWY